MGSVRGGFRSVLTGFWRFLRFGIWVFGILDKLDAHLIVLACFEGFGLNSRFD